MAVQFNHTIIAARDDRATAEWLTGLLGVAPPKRYGPFYVVELENGVTLDVLRAEGPPEPQHYAFLVDDGEFDAIFARIRERGMTYWADPFHREAGRINHVGGGRGVYFSDPDGHRLEVMTRPHVLA